MAGETLTVRIPVVDPASIAAAAMSEAGARPR